MIEVSLYSLKACIRQLNDLIDSLINIIILTLRRTVPVLAARADCPAHSPPELTRHLGYGPARILVDSIIMLAIQASP
jgi:hypothetical protein